MLSREALDRLESLSERATETDCVVPIRASTLAALVAATRERDRLRAAIQPFATLADFFDDFHQAPEDSEVVHSGLWWGLRPPPLTVGDCRRARDVLHPETTP